MNDECEWRATAARGVYKPGCGAGTMINEMPPFPGRNCPYCGRTVTHFISNKARKATLADYRRWKEKQ